MTSGKRAIALLSSAANLWFKFVVAIIVLALAAFLGIHAFNWSVWFASTRYSPKCDLDLNQELRSRAPGPFDLKDVARFDWDEVRIFPEYAALDEVRASGVSYRNLFDHVPEHFYLVVFMTSGRAKCATLVRHSELYYWNWGSEGFTDAVLYTPEFRETELEIQKRSTQDPKRRRRSASRILPHNKRMQTDEPWTGPSQVPPP